MTDQAFDGWVVLRTSVLLHSLYFTDFHCDTQQFKMKNHPRIETPFPHRFALRPTQLHVLSFVFQEPATHSHWWWLQRVVLLLGAMAAKWHILSFNNNTATKEVRRNETHRPICCYSACYTTQNIDYTYIHFLASYVPAVLAYRLLYRLQHRYPDDSYNHFVSHRVRFSAPPNWVPDPLNVQVLCYRVHSLDSRVVALDSVVLPQQLMDVPSPFHSPWRQRSFSIDCACNGKTSTTNRQIRRIQYTIQLWLLGWV